jgi:energy-coupling factor transport system permease protein
VILADDLDPDDAALIRRLVPPTPTAYQRLNPLTKATIATVASLAAFIGGGFLLPLAIIVLSVAGAVAAGVAGRLLRISLLLTLPLAISVILVSALTRPGETVLFVIGPFDVTLEGVDFAAQTVVRLLAISTALGLFTLSTDPHAFVLDLERRGVPSRLAFVAAATVEAVPIMAERANVIAESQRARGLDTEGGIRGRLRGILPIVGPMILSSLTDVEERSLALETRAFTRPGRRHLLWAMPDSTAQRLLRWALLLGLVLLAIGRIAGWL